MVAQKRKGDCIQPVKMLTNLYESKAVQKHCKKKNNPSFQETQMELNSRTICVGGSGSGKTNALVQYIMRAPRTFARIVVVSKGIKEPLYDMLAEKLQGRIVFHSPEDLPEMTKLMEQFDETEEVLLVWDDVVCDIMDDRKLNRKCSLYFLAGRKCNLTQWFLSQSYFKVPKFLRQNATYLILLKLSSAKDLSLVLSDFALGVTADELKDIYREATRERFQFLKVDVMSTDPNRKFSKNFKDFFQIENESDDDDH